MAPPAAEVPTFLYPRDAIAPKAWTGSIPRTLGTPMVGAPMMGLLVAPLFLLRGAASLPVGAAVLRRPLIVSAGETIGIAAIVFGRTGDGRRGGERQNQGCRGNGDQGPHGLLLLVFRATVRAAPADAGVAADVADIQSSRTRVIAATFSRLVRLVLPPSSRRAPTRHSRAGRRLRSKRALRADPRS